MTENDRFHQPPFQMEVIEYAKVAEKGNLFDLYGGDASYGVLLLDAYPELNYWYFDIDDKALQTASERLKKYGGRAHIKKINAKYLEKRIIEEGLSEIDCAIYDPGLRREHVENPQRGFLAKFSGPLDSRYDRSSGKSISDVLKVVSVPELVEILKVVEIPFPSRIARAIVEHRKNNPITTTGELCEIISGIFPARARRKQVPPEILVLLALRIHVNDELEALGEAMRKGFDALRAGGRLITISYHSGEARIYKHLAKEYDIRYAEDDRKRLKVLTKKALKPSDDDIKRNPLIRSAQMRVYEKIR